MTSTAPTHTVVANGWGCLGYDLPESRTVRLTGAVWVDDFGIRYSAIDGLWSHDKWGRVSIDLTTLTPIVGA